MKKEMKKDKALKNGELYNLLESMGRVRNLKGFKFSYAVAKNSNLIRQEIEIFTEMSKPSPEYVAFQKEREDLAKEHAEKDKDGNPIIVGNAYKINDVKKFEKALNPIQEAKKYKKAIDEHQKKMEKFIKFLEEDSDFAPFKVSVKDIPDDISVEQMEGIFVIIQE